MSDKVATPSAEYLMPEHVAFKLFELFVHTERAAGGIIKVDRKYMLDAYAECLQAVKGSRAETKAPLTSDFRR